MPAAAQLLQGQQKIATAYCASTCACVMLVVLVGAVRELLAHIRVMREREERPAFARRAALPCAGLRLWRTCFRVCKWSVVLLGMRVCAARRVAVRCVAGRLAAVWCGGKQCNRVGHGRCGAQQIALVCAPVCVCGLCACAGVCVLEGALAQK